MNDEQFFYLEYPKDIHAEVKWKTCIIEKKYKKDFQLFEKDDEMREKIKEKTKEDNHLELSLKKVVKMEQTDGQLRDIILPFRKVIPYPFMGFKKIDINILKDKPYFDYGENIHLKKHKGVHSIIFDEKIYQVISPYVYCERMKKTYLFRIKLIYYLFEYLELKGCYLTFMNNCLDAKYVEYIYLLSLFFRKLIFIKVIDAVFIQCMDFLGQERISKDTLKKIITKKGVFCIEPKPDLDKFMKYFTTNIKNEMNLKKLLLSNKYNQYVEKAFEKYIHLIAEISTDHPRIYSFINLYKNEMGKDKTKNVIQFLNKKKMKNIKMIEKLNHELQDVIRQDANILEIGMGTGVYTKYLYKMVQKKTHEKLIVIDENQQNIWNNMGKIYLNLNIKNKKFEIFEEPITLSLPKVLNEYYLNGFKIIFIHHFHNFDEIMHNMVFFNKLLTEEGYLIIDKSSYPHVKKWVEYIEMNYPFYQKIECNCDLSIFKKKSIFTELMPRNFYSF